MKKRKIRNFILYLIALLSLTLSVASAQPFSNSASPLEETNWFKNTN